MGPDCRSPSSASNPGTSALQKECSESMEKNKAAARRSMEEMLDRLTEDMDRDGSDWTPARIFLLKMIHSWSFETVIGIQIMVNLVVAVYETDTMSLGMTVGWIYYVNILMFSVYALEVGLRIFVYRKEFFHGIFNWNTFDMVLIATDFIILLVNAFVGGLEQNAMVRCLRVLRALRVITAIRIWPAFRELYIMLHSLIGALRAMLWSTVLLGLILILFSVMAVEMLQPLAEEIAKKDGFGDCERCPEAFRTVWSSAITFFQQIVAGDSWGQVSIPIMEQYPHTTPFFIIVLVIIQFGILNLVLVAIVDQAHKASEDDAQLQARSRKEAFEHQKKTLYHVCRSLDEDHSGDLGIEELTKGFRSNPELANHLKFLDVSLADVQILFNVLDDDGSGTVNYEEFVEQLFKMQNQDTGILLAFLKNYVQDIRGKVGVHTETLESLTQSVHDIKRMLRTLTDQPKQAEVLSSKKDLDEALVVTKNPEESAHQTFGSLEQADMVLEETKAVEESARRSKLLQRSSSEMEKEFELLLQKCCESVSSKMLEHLQRAAKDTVTEWSSSIHSLEQMSMQPCKQAAVSESSVQASTVCSSSGSAESSYLGTEQQYGGAFAVSAFGDTGAGPEAPSELCLPAPSETAFGVPASEISTL